MNGLFFLWVMWAWWIISTFLLEKRNCWRLRSSAVVLILIISFPFGVSLFGYQVGVTAVLIFIFCMIYIKEFSLSEKLYLFLTSFIIGLSYSSFSLLSFYDPIMLVVDKKIMVTGILLILSILLYSDTKLAHKRQLAIVIGLVIGECLTGSVFIQNKLPYQIGGHFFLDVLSIIMVSGFALYVLQYLINSQSSVIKSALKKGEVKNL
jgi:hypothetical protein